MTVLETTSIPAWARGTASQPADMSAREVLILAIGADAQTQAGAWQQAFAESPDTARITVRMSDDLEPARGWLAGELARATVGWRLAVAGPAKACLTLRAQAFAAGVEDDEMRFASIGVDQRDVFCVHCRTTSSASIALEGVVPCPGCDRSLFVHAHVSRMTGAHLGFQVDAEELPGTRPAESA